MVDRLQSKVGKALYALRKQMPELVFGIIKLVMGFGQFSLRDLDKVRGEWKRVAIAWNIRRLFVLAGPA
jgi:Transposase DDE domain